MGTSSSYGGPKGNNPLLPDDFIDSDSTSDSNNSEKPESPVDKPNNPIKDLWTNAKKQISKIANGTSTNTRNALSSYVKASGGSKGAASSASSGKSATVQLGNFLSGISSHGIFNTLDEYKIDYTGKPVEEVFSQLINKLAPIPKTKEETLALIAMTRAVEQLYEKISEDNGELDVLNSLNNETFNEVMEVYICSYIYERLLSDLEFRFEKSDNNIDHVLKVEEDIKEYIKGDVNNALRDVNFTELDYDSGSINKIINNIYSSCYEVIEDSI